MSKLNETYLDVLSYLNETYSQETNKYPNMEIEIFPYDSNVIISYWGCGAYVVIGDMLYEIWEDDSNWFPQEGYLCYDDDVNADDYHSERIYTDNCCDISWLAGKAKALTKLNNYMHNVVWKK